MAMTGISIVISVLMLHYHHAPPNRPVPKWLDRVLMMTKPRLSSSKDVETEKRSQSQTTLAFQENKVVPVEINQVKQGLEWNSPMVDQVEIKDYAVQWRAVLRRMDLFFCISFLFVFIILLIVMIYPYKQSVDVFEC